MLINLAHTIARNRYRLLGFRNGELDLGWSRLHYLEHRAKNPKRTILFLHGLGTSSTSWMRVAPKLRATSDLLIPDLPGYGFSQLAENVSFADLQRLRSAVDEFIQAVALDQFSLVGHSLGGWLAADLALRHPANIKQLVLVNTTGVYYEGVERQRSLFEVDSVEKTRNLMNHLWLSFPWYFRPFIPSIYRELVRRKVTSFVRSVKREDMLNERIAGLHVPTVLVWGRDDRLIGKETITILQQLVPGLTVRMIDRCGHIPQLERPRALTSVLKEILAG